MLREHWRTRIGFVMAAVGSAVGLGSIWRFPYVVGASGGALFILIFTLFLVLISLPVLLSEIAIGRYSKQSPDKAFAKAGDRGYLSIFGYGQILTGFIVSSFYSVIAGQTLGYLIEALKDQLTHFNTPQQVAQYYQQLTSSFSWSIGYHGLFMLFSAGILYLGVQKGIERGNKILMPMLFFVLLILVAKSVTLSGAKEAFEFMFSPHMEKLTFSTIIMALGQAFFSLSLGQGTMITYGSYLSKKEGIMSTMIPIIASVIVVSLLAGFAIFSVVFSAKIEATSGPSLMFLTLPLVFSGMQGGQLLAVLFFFLILVAALTSQISALEPLIAHLIDKRGLKRHKAVIASTMGAFLLGIPAALSFGLLNKIQFLGLGLFDLISSFAINLLIPIGGLAAVVVAGWSWGIKGVLEELKLGSEPLFMNNWWIPIYLRIAIRYIAPVVIFLILINLFGLI